jgi:type I restriction enzyme M protein
MAILGDGRGGVFRVDSSLQHPDEWPDQVRDKVPFGKFDVVLTNPPFGKKIRITGGPVLSQYDMGHKWVRDKTTGKRTLSTSLQRDQPPQLLFVERCLQLLKPGGRLGIVLPESLFGSSSYSHIVEWLQDKAQITAIAAMPEPLFKTSGKVGTHTKVCIVVLQKLPVSGGDEPVFMADAKWCGHDSRGNETLRVEPDGTKTLLDDVPDIASRYSSWRATGRLDGDHLGFLVPRDRLAGTILIPKYYDPELLAQLANLERSHDLPALSQFIESGALQIQTGVEVGKMAYGTGPIPFIRTSDLSNWELKADPKHGVSEELYAELRAQHPDKFDVRAGDILVVKDGTYLVGTSAVVSDLDTRILYQSHLFKVRVSDPGVIDPWLLFAALNSPIAKRQIRAKRFTQDIIDTLGNRLAEVRVPLPRDTELRQRIARETERAVQLRARLREQTRLLTVEIEGEAAHDDLESLVEVD